MHLYRALLHLYPASFRREYGGELVALFERRRRETRGPSRLALWISTVAETLGNASRLHADLARQDLHYALRTLWRTPGFVVTAVLVTALGIGATTAAFSVTDYVFLRPLPYADPDRLVTIWHRTPGYRLELSPPNYRDWKAGASTLDAFGAYHPLEVNVTAGSEPERLTGVAVTEDVLPLLGVAPAIGRVFSPADEREGSGACIVLGYGLW
jgi:hypothetical protein